MSATRPIPIGSNGSQRSSPASTRTSPMSGNPMLSHSLPADMHHVHLSRFMMSASGASADRVGALPAPRTPQVGSMPEPSFLHMDSMPDLELPPPAPRTDESPPRVPSVVQFASSCPGDIGFLRQGNPMQGSWTPSLQPYPVEHDDNDLSKSPALAAMSALRDGRPPTAPGRTGAAQQMNGGSAYRSFGVRAAAGTPPSRHYYASDESSTYAVSAELLERLSITSEEEAEGVEDDEGRYRMPVYNAHVPTDQQRRQSERRGSYGNMSDGGDPGIFDFEDQ